MESILEQFRLTNKVVVITGGAGLLGVKHAQAIAEAGGIPVLWDIEKFKAEEEAHTIRREYNASALGLGVDVTDLDSIVSGTRTVVETFKKIDILINNAAVDPKVSEGHNTSWGRFENYSLVFWNKEISVGLTGAFLCSQVVGRHMAANNQGIIINIASDLSLISPDQRLYRKEGLQNDEQPVKPVTYSVIKHGLLGLTKYLATYWADKNIRVNSISFGGVYTGQPDEFVQRLTSLIPLGRMARVDEYKAAIVFLCSDASSYMTGTNLVLDGGRTCW